MSGFGGFGGFGQNNSNNQQQNSGFGGFGQSSNTNTGFGSTANNTAGFGASTNTGGGLFGSNNNTGFGSSGGFGTTQNNTGLGGFGAAAKPSGFGTAATSGGGLFGSTTTTANSGNTFGGFGANNNNTSAFGAANNSTGGLFGASKPAFGAPASTTTPFGGTSTGFGATTTAFGGSGTTLGGGGDMGQSPGTGGTPFTPFSEKEPNGAANQMNLFQNVCFQQPYIKWSPEELRLADYAQGRKYGNAGGTAGAFGTNTGFGGFGGNTTGTTGFGTNTSTGGMFGANSTNTGFGQTQPTTTGFGAPSTGGLFGAKPATQTGGLFGQAATTTPAAGGLFGSSSTGGAFGSTNTTGFGANNNTNSLFGQNNAAKPSGFSFGNNQPATTTTGFGTNTGTTSAFGNTGSSLFGQNNTNTTSAFGAPAPAQPANNPFGGFGANSNQATGTSSLFGQAKPATTSLFGNNTTASTGGGLFGSNAATTTPANPFGTAAANNSTGSIFGAPKPATTSLFGNANPAPSTNTGGLFGGAFGNNQNNQAQQNNGGGLFGSLNTSQPKPSLFGQNQGGGLFGQNSSSTTNTGLFGNTQNQNQQPQQSQSLFGGSTLFGGSQNQPSQPQSLTASISDPTAFGTSSMFSNLGTPEIHNPGPLATPLSSLSKQKKSGVLQMYKMNPGSASRFSTPQKRGFGFSYSTYGTPGSASSTSSTPLLTYGNSMLGSSLGRGLSKSVSTSSLRGSYSSSFNREDSILAPGAFSASPSSRFNSTGSMKKLVINRSIRQDLFAPPLKDNNSPSQSNGILKKRVSFEASTGGGSNGINVFSSPLKQVQNNSTPSTDDLGFLRPSKASTVNGISGKPSPVISEPDMEQVKGNELAIVVEEDAPAPIATPAPAVSRPMVISQEDGEPGSYWMKPTKEEILNMNRIKRQQVTGFTVGRENVGSITFDAPVDFTVVPIDEIFDKLVVLSVRSATVYGDAAKKPPVGKGLNVPSTISLENSWPRGRDKRTPTHEKAGARFQKHIERLKRVKDTEFVSYNKDTGVWTFKVEHFTTYEFDYDDETDGEGVSEFGMSTLTDPPDTPTPKSKTPKRDASHISNSSTEPDDTFDFKRKNMKLLPGAFDDPDIYSDDREEFEDAHDKQSFLGDRSAGSVSEDGLDDSMDQDNHEPGKELVIVKDVEMAGSFPQDDNTAGREEAYSQDELEVGAVEPSGAIVRARKRAIRAVNSQSKRAIYFDGDGWVDILRQSVSSQKQDREELKRLRDSTTTRGLPEFVKPRVVSDGRGFATSIDLMHSLFGETKGTAKVAQVPSRVPGLQWAQKRAQQNNDPLESGLNDTERAFHRAVKPSWAANGTLVYAADSAAKPWNKASQEKDGIMTVQKGKFGSDLNDVRIAHFPKETSGEAISKQKALTTIVAGEDAPFATLSKNLKKIDIFNDKNISDPASSHEKLVWELASILFDPVEVPSNLRNVLNADNLLRRDLLSDFWQKLVEQSSNMFIALAKTNEEKAIAALSGHRIAEACEHLVNGKDLHLATLVSLVGGNDTMQKEVRQQMNLWQKTMYLSEFSPAIRAIYEILSGNVCVCDGTKGAPLEDRVESFVISKRFGLDWRQSFGLRLWYAITSSDDIARAVKLFSVDLQQDREYATPLPWYVEQEIPLLWEDADILQREDLLWGLLKLYANPDTDLQSILRPENSQTSPLDVRLSWQLSCSLLSSGAATYGTDASGNEKADQLTLAFAAQLTKEGNWLDAIFVLLHLSSSVTRVKTIRDHLTHHAEHIGPEDSQAFKKLAKELLIPEQWIWEAKALYMRSVVKDPKREVECLLRASLYDEAHLTFRKEVAPKAVIERDWETLRLLLSGFKGQKDIVAEWRLGGELYEDYLLLLGGQKKSHVDNEVIERLLAALPAMVTEGRGVEFIESVAIAEISAVVAKVVVAAGKNGNETDRARVLRLPLTEDRRLKHTIDLSVDYYRALMAGGR